MRTLTLLAILSILACESEAEERTREARELAQDRRVSVEVALDRAARRLFTPDDQHTYEWRVVIVDPHRLVASGRRMQAR